MFAEGVILATVTAGEAMTAAMGSLAVNETFMILGAANSLQVNPLLLISGRRAVKAGTPAPRSIRRTRFSSAPSPACDQGA